MHLRFSEEVDDALAQRRPLVALESSVVAQGLPYPHNLEAARACEEAVRRAGATPAAIAVIDGEIRVGLDAAALRRLAEGKEPLLKLGSRDLPMAVANARSGGTTVSATCEIAARAKIAVFATGGIGGVHRGAADHFDISQDLWALSKFPVGVVCAGAKSVLDLPKTLEVLESLAVPVIGVGTREFPSFFSRTSGLPLEYAVADAREAAKVLDARITALGQGGILFAQPPPESSALPTSEVELHIASALRDAAERGVKGKEVTPFLLGELVRRTAGKTLRTNIDLLVNNARFAGELAVQHAKGGNLSG